MFERALRRKLRFNHKGLISTEDLWDLSITDLDAIYKTLNAKVKASQEESLLATKTTAEEDLTLSLDIVKHIVSVKLADKAAKETSAAKKVQRDRIREVLANKQDEALLAKTPEELAAMLEELK